MTSELSSTHVLFRRSDYVAMPWRNGGGTTFEIARQPASGADFEWRLSLALIERSGPFSNFAGYQRAIALVSGAGCRLSGIEARPVVLDVPGSFALFSGASAVSSELIDGSCCDFNLMVREPGAIHSVRAERLVPGADASLPADYYGAVFCLAGAIECASPLEQQRVTLNEQDTLIAHPEHAGRWRMRAAGPQAMILLLSWE
jgi:environmental stress-induced protein Ves